MILPEIALIVSSCISFLFSMSVLLTILMFPRLRAQEFMQITFFMVISWMITNIGQFLGFPPSDSIACQLQAFVLIYFTGASACWMVIMFYQFYCLALDDRFELGPYSRQLICWGFPAILAFLPLLKLSYGRPQDFFPYGDGNGVCNFTFKNKIDYLEWFVAIVMSQGILFLIYIFYIALRIYFRFRAIGAPIKAVLAWPLIIILTWFPWIISATVFFVSNSTSEFDTNILHYAYAWLVQTGTLGSIAFYVNSLEVRQSWYRYVVDGYIVPADNDSSSIKYSSIKSSLHRQLSDSMINNLVEDITISNAEDQLLSTSSNDSKIDDDEKT